MKKKLPSRRAKRGSSSISAGPRLRAGQEYCRYTNAELLAPEALDETFEFLRRHLPPDTDEIHWLRLGALFGLPGQMLICD